MPLSAANLIGRVAIQGAGDAVRDLHRVGGAVTTAQSSLSKFTSGSGQLAAGVVRLGAVAAGAATAGLFASAKAAINWEDAFAGVRKTVDASPAQLTKLGEAFRTMATEIPISATELARLGEAGGALGIPVDQLKNFVKVSALLGVTTDVSSEQAATALGQLSNLLPDVKGNYDRLASTLVALGNQGASTESSILEMAQRIAGTGNLVGLSASEVFGWSAALANAGVNAEAGGTAISTFFAETFKDVVGGTADLKLLAGMAGTSGKAFQEMFASDPSGALEKLIVGFAGLTDAQRLATLETLGFTDRRLSDALLRLTGDTTNLSNALDVQEKGWRENTALSDEAQKRFDTVASQLAILRNNFTEAGINIGEGLLPSIKRFSGQLSGFLKTNSGELKAFGRSIGSTLDQVNWTGVLQGGRDLVGVLQQAAGHGRGLVDAINALPTEVKAGGLALFAANKLSGNLLAEGIANMLSGALGALLRGGASRIPGLGALVAVPVRVINWPPGFTPTPGGGDRGTPDRRGGRQGSGGGRDGGGGRPRPGFRPGGIRLGGAGAFTPFESMTESMTWSGALADELGIGRHRPGPPLQRLPGGVPVALPPGQLQQIRQPLTNIALQEQRQGERTAGRLDLLRLQNTRIISAIERSRVLRGSVSVNIDGRAVAHAVIRYGGRASGVA